MSYVGETVYDYHETKGHAVIFRESGEWTVPLGVTKVNVLVVGGGGGGGDRVGGGGGAGGLMWEEEVTVTPEGTVTVTVGDGGAGNTSNNNGANGENSVFGDITALGGGGGGGGSGAVPGADGGSGGGGAGYSSGTGGSATDTDPPNEVYQGHDGGSHTQNWAAGGGGGAGGPGTDGGVSANPGPGGDGLEYADELGLAGQNRKLIGDDCWFAGGGGGAGYTGMSLGSKGGGGLGGATQAQGWPGMPNTGGGGGGRERMGQATPGGSGVVIIQYTTSYKISGKVTLDAADVEGANVRLAEMDRSIYAGEVQTDASGEYEFTNLLPGKKYHVLVDHEDSPDMYNAESYPFVTPLEPE